MKRKFEVLYPEAQQEGFVPGDEAAHRAAAALADRADYPTISAFCDMLTFLERVGGQFHVTALRLQNEDTEEWDTYGLAFNFETRDARVKVADPPTGLTLGGQTIPITDSQLPPAELLAIAEGATAAAYEDEELAEGDMAAGSETLDPPEPVAVTE